MVDDKPKYAVGCTGHINLLRINGFYEIEQNVRMEISAYFKQLKERYTVTLYSGLANGADSLFAEEALKCGVDIVAVLPDDWKAFMDEQQDQVCFMRLLNASSHAILCPNGYVGVMDKILEVSDEIFTLWDGVALPLTDENNREINRGGTYDLIRTAQFASKKIKHFNHI